MVKRSKIEMKKEARPPFLRYVREVYPGLKLTGFHKTYYRILDEFACGRIRKLIITAPPQHGKSLGSSVLLPSYILGLDPDAKIAIASYAMTLASRFNRRVQRLIDSDKYKKCFPETSIKPLSGRSEALRTATETEVRNHDGGIIAVGREGALTGNEVDVLVLDDLYKDQMEANSPVIRENCWEWYTSVVRTRMHNRSSELITFTRWHDEDLIASILEKEPHVVFERWGQIGKLRKSEWLVVNFEAIKQTPPTQADPRKEGEALWPARHSLELLQQKRALDPLRFDCMYQGRPSPKAGLLYGDRFASYACLPKDILRKGNYTDTADLGDDYLCSVCYEAGADGLIYITDVVYSREGMEVTERLVADMLNRNMTRHAYVESNNGGRGFARAVGREATLARVEWFHQNGNKEARILSNSSTVMKYILMPADWARRWPQFHNHLVTYKRLFHANRWHDAADVLTGIVEKEIVEAISKRIRKIGY